MAAPRLTLTEPASREERVQPPSWAGLPHPRPGEAVYLEVSDAAGGVTERRALGSRALWLLGRHEKFAQVITTHESISRQHAALVYHAAESRWYVCDLRSARGTFLAGTRLAPYVATPLPEATPLTLGEDRARLYRVHVRADTTPETHAEAEANAQRAAKRARTDAHTHTDATAAEATQRVHASHILLKHTDSRNPVSWRQPQSTVTRSPADARAQLTRVRDELRALERAEGTAALGARVTAVARDVSDCASAKRGGDLGTFARGQMQPAFEHAAFALAPGTLSDLVDSDSGVHLIWRHPL